MSFKIAVGQINPVVGDVDGNVERILGAIAEARDRLGAHLIMLPELAICGYPPEDLLFHGNMRRSVAAALDALQAQVQGIDVLVGYPEYEGERIYNSAALIRDGAVDTVYRKQLLPNYGVFDEQRYFSPGQETVVTEIGGVRCGLLICEDVWEPAPSRAAVAAGAEILLIINGSPYDTESQARRERVMVRCAEECAVPLVYCNMVGGQDELVFDGGSLAMDGSGEVQARAPAFEEVLMPVPGEFHFREKDQVALSKHQPRRARGAIKGMMMQEAHVVCLAASSKKWVKP